MQSRCTTILLLSNALTSVPVLKGPHTPGAECDGEGCQMCQQDSSHHRAEKGLTLPGRYLADQPAVRAAGCVGFCWRADLGSLSEKSDSAQSTQQENAGSFQEWEAESKITEY